MFTEFYRIWGRRLTDCLWIFIGFGGGGLRIVYGFLPDLVEEAYELFTDFYRIWGKRLADCLWISIGFGGEGLRIVCGFLPDVEDEACGLRMFTGCRGRGLRIVYGFLPDLGEEAYGLFPDFYRIWGRIGGIGLADCFWIGTGFGGEGLRIWIFTFGGGLGE